MSNILDKEAAAYYEDQREAGAKDFVGALGKLCDEYDANEGGPVTLEDERRGHHFNQLITMGCSPDVAAQVVGGMTFSKVRNPADKPKWAYIAGPMRGYPDFNFPMFDRFRDVALTLGFDVISPADIDRTAGDTDEGDQSRFAMRDFWSLYFIKAKDDGINAVVMLPGWEDSVGATAEKGIADWLKLDSYYGVSLNRTGAVHV